MGQMNLERTGTESAQAASGVRPYRSWPYRALLLARRYPLGAFGAVTLLVLALVAVAAPVIANHDPFFQDVARRLTGPSTLHWLGTDRLGRDVFSRIVFGSRISLYVGFTSVFLAVSVGTILGVTSGYLGGRFDLIVQRIVDAFLGFPNLLLALLMMVALGASLNNLTLAIALGHIPSVTRLARSSALSVAEEVYVAAARAMGCTNVRIVLRHVLPNAIAPVFVVATAQLGSAIVSEAGLSFLGLGAPPPIPSWGAMINGGARKLEIAPWVAIFPGLALTGVVLAFALLGDALRDHLDPRLRGR